MAVAQDRRPPAADVVEVPPAVGVPDVARPRRARARAAGRPTEPERPDRAVDAAREEASAALDAGVGTAAVTAAPITPSRRRSTSRPRISPSGRWTPSSIGVSLTVERRLSVAAQCANEIAEGDQIVRVVGDHEVLVVEPERIGQQPGGRSDSVADPHVLVHHRPGALLASLEVPVGALGERVDDQVAGERRRRTATDPGRSASGRTATARSARAGEWRTVSQRPRPDRASRAAGGLERRRPMARYATEQDVDAGLEADRRIASGSGPRRRSVAASASSNAAIVRALAPRPASAARPGRDRARRLDVRGLVAHRRSPGVRPRSRSARSAAA